MKTKGKAWHLIATVLLIVVFVYTAFFGVYAKYGDTTTTYIKGAKDIRFGVDIKGGVNVTFVPSDGYDATEEQLEAAQLVIENRLVALNVTDDELYVDNNSDSLILEFPWQSGETDFDPEAAIDEIGTTAYLTFREGSSADGELILDGSMIESTAAQYGPISNGGASEYFVSLKFTDDGAKAFGDATTKLAASGGTISIWLDDENVSTATVNTAITDGSAIITSSASNPFTQEQVVKMARQINSGALPFALTVDSYSTVSPSLGENSLSAMVLAGVIAFALIVVFMTVLYRLPGFLACIALAGQVAATLAFVSGYFPVFESFTMTLPGIAGIILAIGMGVDANVITAERIKEELKNGKSLDGALKSGFARGLTPIVDGNVTIVIVAIVLMGAFGPSDGMFAKALHFVFFAFGPSTAGTIYAFGYTLLTGVLLNFVFGVFATRVMIRGAASIKALRNPWLYGAVKPGKEVKEKNRGESLAYLEKNKKKKGVKVLASGVQYEELKAGTGPSPKEEDVVTMVYVGKLVNGTPFTNAEGTPAEEKDVVMTLIPGFKEGLSQMKEGGKAVFVIPADKGYGENGAGPVPPESALIFEVTLKKVEKPGANKESNQAMPAGHPPMNGSRPKMAWPHS